MGTMIRPNEDRDLALVSKTPAASPHVLVATNGCGGSDGAVSIAIQLLEHSPARVGVIGVIDPAQLSTGKGSSASCSARAYAQSELMEQILVQLSRVAPGSAGCSVEVLEGDPALVLSRLASQRNVRLIITGLGHHDADEDRFGAEITLRTLGMAKVPVLAVPESSDRLPERALVATDFSEYSLNAAREALALFPSLTDVDFVHVVPATTVEMAAIHRWLTPSGRDPASRLDDVRRRIGAYAGVTYKTTALTGESAQEILRHARETGTDIIVAGSRGAGLAQRIIVGSTATQLLREAECAILAVPVPTTRPWARLAEMSARMPAT